MSYNITKFDGTQFALVADGTINTTLDITLIGKNYAGYGEKQNENFLWLLEHFANVTPPPKATKGQAWFNSTSDKLKLNVYDGVTWKTLAITSVTTPSNPIPSINPQLGDMWYDETSKQLKVFNGSDYTLVGPQSVTGYGVTQMKSVEIEDSQSNFHAIQEAWASGQRVFVINSNADFTPKNAIAGFTTIFQGLTLNSSYKLYGTATNSEKLGGQFPAFYAPITSPTFLTSINVPNDGVNIGTAFTIKNLSGIPTIKNNSGDTVKFQTTSGSTVNTPVQLVGKDILPGVNFGTDLGSTLAQFNNVYAGYIYSTAQKADSLNLSGNYLTASASAGPNTIAARNSSGNLTAIRFIGKADSSLEADHAILADNATLAGVANVANYIRWDQVDQKPSNFVYNNSATYNISITGNVTGNVVGNLTGATTGTHLGNVVGNVTGDTTGFHTGNVFGNVTGNLTGNVTGNTAGVHTGNVFGNVIGNVTGNLTGNVTGNTAGVHTGNVTGNITGNLTGNTTGLHTGNVIGAVTGNVTGDSQGTHSGNVVGNVTGNVTGNLTGNVSGNVSGNAGTVTNGVYITDTGTVTNTMLAGSIANNKLSNSSITFGSTTISLGSTSATISGLSTVTSNSFVGNFTGDVVGNITGNAQGSASNIRNLGTIVAESNGTGEPGQVLTLRSVYNNGYPTAYGNVITLGGNGGGQVLVGWSGSTGSHADNYIRSRRDTGNTWSPWAKVLTDVNFGATLATVASTGSYTDLSNKPTIPAPTASPQAQLQNIVKTIMGSIDMYMSSSSGSGFTSGYVGATVGAGWSSSTGDNWTYATTYLGNTSGSVSLMVDLAAFLGLSNNPADLTWKGNHDFSMQSGLMRISDYRIQYYGMGQQTWGVQIAQYTTDKINPWYGRFTITLTIGAGDHWYHGTSIRAGWIGIGSRTNNVYTP